MNFVAGLVGLFRVVFESVVDGYSCKRAWLVVTIMALVVVSPLLLIAALLLLIAQFV